MEVVGLYVEVHCVVITFSGIIPNCMYKKLDYMMVLFLNGKFRQHRNWRIAARTSEITNRQKEGNRNWLHGSYIHANKRTRFLPCFYDTINFNLSVDI